MNLRTFLNFLSFQQYTSRLVLELNTSSRWESSDTKSHLEVIRSEIKMRKLEICSAVFYEL